MKNDDKDVLLTKAAAEVKVQNKLKSIYFSWPNLHQATLKLADYMGSDIPSKDGVSLYAKCIKAAVDKYESCAPQEISTTAQMYAYLDGLLEHTPEIIDVHLATKKKPRKSWEPFDNSIFEFLAQNTESEVVKQPYCSTSPESIRLMILARIINIKDLQWIEDGKSICNFFNGLNTNGTLVTH